MPRRGLSAVEEYAAVLARGLSHDHAVAEVAQSRGIRTTSVLNAIARHSKRQQALARAEGPVLPAVPGTPVPWTKDTMADSLGAVAAAFGLTNEQLRALAKEAGR